MKNTRNKNTKKREKKKIVVKKRHSPQNTFTRAPRKSFQLDTEKHQKGNKTKQNGVKETPKPPKNCYNDSDYQSPSKYYQPTQPHKTHLQAPQPPQNDLSRVVTVQSQYHQHPLTPKNVPSSYREIHCLHTLRRIIAEMKSNLVMEKTSNFVMNRKSAKDQKNSQKIHKARARHVQSTLKEDRSAPACFKKSANNTEAGNTADHNSDFLEGDDQNQDQEDDTKTRKRLNTSDEDYIKGVLETGSGAGNEVEEVVRRIKLSTNIYSEVKQLIQHLEEASNVIVSLQNDKAALHKENLFLKEETYILEQKILNFSKEMERIEFLDSSLQDYIQELDGRIKARDDTSKQVKQKLAQMNKKLDKNGFGKEILYRDKLIEDLWNEVKRYRKREKRLLRSLEGGRGKVVGALVADLEAGRGSKGPDLSCQVAQYQKSREGSVGRKKRRGGSAERKPVGRGIGSTSTSKKSRGGGGRHHHGRAGGSVGAGRKTLFVQSKEVERMQAQILGRQGIRLMPQFKNVRFLKERFSLNCL